MSRRTDRRPPDFRRGQTAQHLADLLVLTPDVRDRIADALRFARDIGNAEIAVVSMSDPDGNWYAASVGAEVPPAVHVAFCGRVVRNRRPLIVLATQDDPRFCHPSCAGASDFARSYLGFPLGHGLSELPGVLALANVAKAPSTSVTRRLGELTEQVSILLMDQPLRQRTEADELGEIVRLDAFTSAVGPPPNTEEAPTASIAPTTSMTPTTPMTAMTAKAPMTTAAPVASVRSIHSDVSPQRGAALASSSAQRLLDNLDSFLDRDLGGDEFPDVATCFIDISTFAVMDEVLGEEAANQILIDLGDRLRRHLRGEERVGPQANSPITVLSHLSPESIRRLAEGLLAGLDR